MQSKQPPKTAETPKSRSPEPKPADPSTPKLGSLPIKLERRRRGK